MNTDQADLRGFFIKLSTLTRSIRVRPRPIFRLFSFNMIFQIDSLFEVIRELPDNEIKAWIVIAVRVKHLRNAAGLF
jgi:hypothetical protein